jgi:monoamine oxidase
LHYWDQGREFKGGDVLFPNGYDQITKGLAQGLDIRLEHIVQKIQYDNRGVKIITNQGEFSCERAVITLPLGVLKSGAVKFSPALPQSKQAAIQRLGMGVLNKVYLRFPKVFWQDTDILGYISQNKGEWAEFLNIHKYIKQPVLLGFNAATYGSQIEKLSDKQIVGEAMKVLQNMYGTGIPNPEASLITRWQQDPFARGSYSYIPPGASRKDYDEIAKPIQNRLFFAGEATSSKYAATVHGAFLSGEREAQKIGKI